MSGEIEKLWAREAQIKRRIAELQSRKKTVERTLIGTALLLLSLSYGSVAIAAPAPGSVADCDEIKKSAMAAQVKYIQVMQPRQDPVKVFDDSVGSCLENIGSLQISIPSIWDGALAAIMRQLTQRVCQAARSQFDQAVGSAMQTVNQDVGTIPGSGGMSTGIGVNRGYGSPGVQVQQNTTAAQGAVDRVVNIIK